MNISAQDVLLALFNPEDTVCFRVFDDKKKGVFSGAKLEMEAGKYPFASMVRKGGTGRRTFEISRKAYENWKEINLRSV